MNSGDKNISKAHLLMHKAHTAMKIARYKLNPLELRLQKSALQKSPQNLQIDFNDRTKILNEFQHLISEKGEQIPSKTICDYFFDEKIREKTVLLVGLGKNVRGNMQYILNTLNYNDEYNEFHIYVRTSYETDKIVKEYIKNNRWFRTETVPDDTEYSKLMESAQYFLTEVFFPEAWVKKPGQLYINIWHGTPLKKLGLAKNQKNKHKSGIIQKNFIDADYLLYPNNYTKENMLTSYKVASLINGQILMLGYPRTGGMLSSSLNDQIETRRVLAPNGEKIFVYMPTFRDYLSNDQVVDMSKTLLDYMEENLRDDQILYVNLHHKVGDSIDYSKYTHIKKFPPTVDSYRILAASEALITDYSSVFFDYLALKKQIILYIEDYETYRSKRGMYMDLLKLPFDKATTKEELLDALNRGKLYDDSQVYQEFCSYDTVDNAKKLCQLFLNNENDLHLESLPKNNKFRFLIYSDVFQEGTETQFLSDFIKRYNKKNYEIYLSCDMNTVGPDKNSVYSIMDKTAVIGTEQNPHLSGMGKTIKNLYLDGKLSFEQAITYLKYDYAVAGMRMYGRAEFDAVLIYDVINPETVITLGQLSAPKILFLTDHMLSELQSGNTFLKDALCYVSNYCSSIFAGSQAGKETAKKILNTPVINNIQVINLSKKL